MDPIKPKLVLSKEQNKKLNAVLSAMKYLETHQYYRVKEFAIEAHKGQKYGEFLYTVHLSHVEKVLLNFGHVIDKYLIYGAWLHDVVEDTEVTIGKIRQKFGPTIMDLIHRVTDEPGKNRRERKANTYPKIKGHERATILKLADRIANVEHGIYNSGESKFEMYKKEQPSFREGIYVPEIAEEMWKYLENDLLLKKSPCLRSHHYMD